MANRVNPINPADVNMKVNIAGVTLNNPVMTASGTLVPEKNFPNL